MNCRGTLEVFAIVCRTDSISAVTSHGQPYLGVSKMKWTEATTTNTGNLDDFDFSGADLLRCNNASLLTIRGLRAGVGGQVLTIVSVGAGQVDLSPQDTGDSTAANRLICFATSGKTSLAAGVGTAMLQYDGTTQRWRLVSHEQGDWISPAFNAGDYTANGSMTWTVGSGDVITNRFYLRGRQLSVDLDIRTTSVGGTLNTNLQIACPGGYTLASALTRQVCLVNDNSAFVSIVARIQQLGGVIMIQQPATNAANWTASTDLTTVFAGGLTFGVV